MAECRPIPGEYTWQNCEDFQLPQNSVWYGRDDDGSDIFCGKAWCDGEEVPAKVIPNRRECKVIDNGCERVVPNCRKVLICRRDEGDNCHRRRDHCHRRRSCHCHDNSSSSESDQEESTTTEKSTCCNNESKVLEKNVKSCSSSNTTIVKKGSKNHHKKGGNECWYETRTRMVPKVTVQPRVRYFPKVINERTVRYVQERYTVKVCGRRCESSETCRPCEPCNPCKPCEPCNPCEPCEPCNPCEPCEPCNPCEPCEPCRPCEPCEPCQPCEPCDPCDPCSSNRKNKTVVISEHSEEKKQSHRCRSKSPSRKIKWF